MRDSIIFYRSFYESLKDLSPDVQADVYTAIFEYSLNFNQVELTGVAKAIFTLIKPQLDANNQRYENGKKGGRTKKTSPAKNRKGTKKEPKPNQTKTETEANVNVNVNDIPKGINISLEERKLEFKKRVIAEQCEKYNLDLLRDFFVYWSEHGDKDKKMRWEKEKTFGLRSRLHTFKNLREQWKTKKDRL